VPFGLPEAAEKPMFFAPFARLQSWRYDKPRACATE
jgi:hypothetical protein